jgi:hypothetical protein
LARALRGAACKWLAEAGLKVALLDAGLPQSDKNFTEHLPAFQLKYRNRAPEVIRNTPGPKSVLRLLGIQLRMVL